MENRTKRALAVMAAVVLVLVMAIVPACKKEEQFGAQGVTNFTGLQVDQPTSAPTNEPGLLVNNESALGAAVDVQIAGTSALLVDADGNTTIAGTCSGCSISSSSNLVVAGPTAMTTATPMFIANTAADVPDLFVISKDATPVVYVHNDGSSDVVGDLDVGDTLNVDGDIDLDGDGFDVNITAGASIDTDGATNLSASTGDITVDAEAGSVLIIGSEGAADAVEIDANDTVTSGVDIDVGSVSGMTIDGGLLNIGGATAGVADGDNDVVIVGVLEVDGEIEVDGTLDIDSTATLAAALTIEAGGKIIPSTTTGTEGMVFCVSGQHTHASTETAADLVEIPANANIIDWAYQIETDWDDNATATVDCGIKAGDTDALLDGVDVNGVGDNTYARMGSAAEYPEQSGLGDVGAADVTIQCQVAEGDNDASEGAATLFVWYIID